MKKMPKTVYFIRHGETNFNTDPVPKIRGRIEVQLNEEGLRHASQAADFLKDVKLTKIYYSKITRAKQTADAVFSNHKDAKFIEEPLMIDISWGDWEGKTYQEAFGDEKGGDFSNAPQKLSIPNGESFYQVLDRIKKFFDRVLDSDEDNICVVTHGAITNLVACFIADAPISKFWNFYMSGCGVSKLQLNSIDDIKVKYWNACHFLK